MNNGTQHCALSHLRAKAQGESVQGIERPVRTTREWGVWRENLAVEQFSRLHVGRSAHCWPAYQGKSIRQMKSIPNHLRAAPLIRQVRFAEN
jgi:hypothetical protein